MVSLSQLSNASRAAFPQSKFSCSLGSSGPLTNVISFSCCGLIKPASMLPFTSVRSGSQKESTLRRATAVGRERLGCEQDGIWDGEGKGGCGRLSCIPSWVHVITSRTFCSAGRVSDKLQSYGGWWISITSSNVPNPPGKPMNALTRVAISILRSCIEFTRIWKERHIQNRWLVLLNLFHQHKKYIQFPPMNKSQFSELMMII